MTGAFEIEPTTGLPVCITLPSGKAANDPVWWWSCDCNGNAGNRFAVRKGLHALRLAERSGGWERHRASMPIGDREGASLADCMYALIWALNGYDVEIGHAIAELARMPAFAEFLHNSGRDMCDFVSNPSAIKTRNRVPYDGAKRYALECRVKKVIGLT